jgi:uncharacterized protein (TIGR02117 family)
MRINRGLAVVLGSIWSVATVLTIGYFTPVRSSDRATVDHASMGCQYKVCAARFGIHTGLIVPVQNDVFDWQDHLSLNLTHQQYLGFGFGERNWYINPPTELGDVLRKGSRALLLPSSPVLSVQKHDRFPNYFEIECVGVKKADYLALMQFIKNSFHRTQGEAIQVAYRPDQKIAYYEATGHYSIVRNSNHWTAAGLSAAHINTPLWAGLSTSIMHHLKGTCSI